MTRRSATVIADDRNALVAYVEAAVAEALAEPGTPDYYVPLVRVPKWAAPGDVTAVVKAGRLDRTVRKEWDTVTRRTSRAYLTTPQPKGTQQ